MGWAGAGVPGPGEQGAAGNRIASHDQSTVVACCTGVPSPSRYLKAAGTHSTTTSTRRLWPAATRLRSAPLRAPRLTISPEPPGMLEKKAVARSSPVRRISHTLTTLDTLVISAPKKIRPKWLRTCSITTGVKCKPMPMPTTHWPHLRAGDFHQLPWGQAAHQDDRQQRADHPGQGPADQAGQITAGQTDQRCSPPLSEGCCLRHWPGHDAGRYDDARCAAAAGTT